MSGKNGSTSSYQKYDGASGTYQQIGSEHDDLNGGANGSGSTLRRNRFLKLAGLVVVAAGAVGLYYAFTKPAINNQQQIDKTISSSGKIQVKSNGRLKLFDNLST